MPRQTSTDNEAPNTETIFVFISADNGAARIEAGEPELDVIRGGWVCSLERAQNVDHLIAVDADGDVMSVHRAAFDFSEAKTTPNKTYNLVWFALGDAPELDFMVGNPSPVRQRRNPVAYASTEWLLHGDATHEDTDNATRAVVQGYVLDVDDNGDAYVTAPDGGSVTVLCR